MLEAYHHAYHPNPNSKNVDTLLRAFELFKKFDVEGNGFITIADYIQLQRELEFECPGIKFEVSFVSQTLMSLL